MLQAEPLDQVASQAEAEEQDQKKPDPPRQYGMHLNATLTIQTRRRYSSTLPKNLEELRQKYDVLSNCWLLGQQRQPGRALYSDVDSSTFPRILKELLGKKHFALKKLEGQPLVAPPWTHCLSYEYELRREAYKRCREQSMGFHAAWWSPSIACSIGSSSSAWPTQHRQSSNSLSQVLYRKKCTTPRKRCGPESEQQEMGNTWKTRKQEVAAHWAAAASTSQFFVVNSCTKGEPEEQAEAGDRVGAHLPARCGL